jgi:hypothetical protein
MPEGKRRHMTKFRLDEISAVDFPAQIHARAVLMKRAIKKSMALTTAEDGHTHLIDTVDYDGREVRAGMSSWVNDHSHPWIMELNGSITIGEAEGHTHSIETIVKGKSPAQTGEGETASTEDKSMPENKTEAQIAAERDAVKADLEKAQGDLAKATAALETATADLKFLKAKDAMSDKERAAMANMDDEEAGNFVFMSTDARAEKMATIAKAAEDKDPVVYTSDTGSVFRKSDDPRLVTMAKERDADRKEAETLRKQAADAAFTKRAETELQYLPGTVAVRSAILKAVSGIEDETLRTEAEKVLKAHNARHAGAFETIGHSIVKKDDGTAFTKADASSELNRLAKARAEKDGIDFYEAYDKVSEENPTLLQTAIAG